MALTKADFATQLLDELGLSKLMAKDLVELFFEEIKSTLEHAESVKISGFDKFELRDKVPRPGRNPKTGEEIPISARRVVTFKPGTRLKAKIELMDVSNST
jgi:integration host factor subunit alpha